MLKGFLKGVEKSSTGAHLVREERGKKVYEGNDADLLKLYETGRSVSLSYFETLYKKLGTKFDYLFFESDTGVRGKKIVTKNSCFIINEPLFVEYFAAVGLRSWHWRGRG